MYLLQGRRTHHVGLICYNTVTPNMLTLIMLMYIKYDISKLDYYFEMTHFIIYFIIYVQSINQSINQ